MFTRNNPFAGARYQDNNASASWRWYSKVETRNNM